MSQFPFFVYGTLLPGQCNDHYWGGYILRSVPAVLSCAKLYEFPGYPMLIESLDSASKVVGQIIWVGPDRYEAVLTKLDQLEEYDPADVKNSFYLRLAKNINTGNGSSITTWVYVGKPNLIKGLPAIIDGDWARHMANNLNA
jgi:gamma-glutamylcyclotransferase (GGCT)/AIG2-like uncharacterized protein YtfP